MKKIDAEHKIKSITITRAEGKIEECGIDHHAKTWEEADDILFTMSLSAPKEGGYDKTDFKIIFNDKDNTEYSGTYDLKHHSIDMPNLYDHVSDYVAFYSGKRKPSYMSQEQYDNLVSYGNKDEYQEFAFKFLGLVF